MCPKSGSSKALVCVGAILIFSTAAVFAQRMVDFDIGQSNFIAPPRLIAPSADVIDLTGKDTLEFKWSPHEGDQVKREYYDLRLYRGYEMLESTRILKMRLPPRQWSLSLKSDMFEDGQAYTWSVRQVYVGVKSRRSFDSFKVIRKR